MALATCIAFGYALEAGEVRPSAGVIEPKVIALASSEKYRGYSSGADIAWEFEESDLSGGIIVRKSGASDVSPIISKVKDDDSNTSKCLKSIKSAFSLSNEELSAVLRSSRKTLHNWMNEGAFPNKSKARRIVDINEIAQAWRINGYDKYPEMLHQRNQENVSILDMLAMEELDKEDILFRASGLHFQQYPAETLEDPFA